MSTPRPSERRSQSPADMTKRHPRRSGRRIFGSAFAFCQYVLDTVPLSWSKLVRRTGREVVDDDVVALTAQLSFTSFSPCRSQKADNLAKQKKTVRSGPAGAVFPLRFRFQAIHSCRGRSGDAHDAPVHLRSSSIHGGDLLRHFHISVGDLPSQVVTRQLEGHFSIGDAHVGVVLDRLEIGDEAVHKTERVHEILKFERPGQLVLGGCPSANRGMMTRSSLDVRILGLSIVVTSVPRLTE
jgi:hypothetical protein